MEIQKIQKRRKKAKIYKIYNCNLCKIHTDKMMNGEYEFSIGYQNYNAYNSGFYSTRVKFV